MPGFTKPQAGTCRPASRAVNHGRPCASPANGPPGERDPDHGRTEGGEGLRVPAFWAMGLGVAYARARRPGCWRQVQADKLQRGLRDRVFPAEVREQGPRARKPQAARMPPPGDRAWSREEDTLDGGQPLRLGPSAPGNPKGAPVLEQTKAPARRPSVVDALHGGSLPWTMDGPIQRAGRSGPGRLTLLLTHRDRISHRRPGRYSLNILQSRPSVGQG